MYTAGGRAARNSYACSYLDVPGVKFGAATSSCVAPRLGSTLTSYGHGRFFCIVFFFFYVAGEIVVFGESCSAGSTVPLS